MGGSLEAVVFDFDGLLVDTETSIFEISAAALAAMGHELTIPQWASSLGRGHDDSWAAMCAALGASPDRVEFQRHYDAQDLSWRDHLPLVSGVVELLDALDGEGVPCGVASSSSANWVVGHLRRLDIFDRFATVATRDRVGGRAKPAPDVYLLACADLGADPSRSVAVEDAAPGIAAAKAAGMRTVAIPSHITKHTDLSQADLTVESLDALTVEILQALFL